MIILMCTIGAVCKEKIQSWYVACSRSITDSALFDRHLARGEGVKKFQETLKSEPRGRFGEHWQLCLKMISLIFLLLPT